MKEVSYDQSDETAYECFECGTIVTAESAPVTCPDCGGSMRNRSTPLE